METLGFRDNIHNYPRSKSPGSYISRDLFRRGRGSSQDLICNSKDIQATHTYLFAGCSSTERMWDSTLTLLQPQNGWPVDTILFSPPGSGAFARNKPPEGFFVVENWATIHARQLNELKNTCSLTERFYQCHSGLFKLVLFPLEKLAVSFLCTQMIQFCVISISSEAVGA